MVSFPSDHIARRIVRDSRDMRFSHSDTGSERDGLSGSRRFLRRQTNSDGPCSIFQRHFRLSYAAHNLLKTLMLIECRPVVIPCRQQGFVNR